MEKMSVCIDCDVQIEDLLDSYWDPDLVRMGEILRDNEAFYNIYGITNEDVADILQTFIQDPKYKKECLDFDGNKFHLISTEDGFLTIYHFKEAEADGILYLITVNRNGIDLIKPLIESKYQIETYY